jgi:hypothetical protein
MPNQRKFTRATFSLKAEIDHRGKVTEGEVVNLSLQGLLARTSATIKPGEPLRITLRVTGQTSTLAIHADATAVRTSAEGVAVRFEKVDLDSYVHLRHILADKIGGLDKLDEEFINYIQENESFIVQIKQAPVPKMA